MERSQASVRRAACHVWNHSADESRDSRHERAKPTQSANRSLKLREVFGAYACGSGYVSVYVVCGELG